MRAGLSAIQQTLTPEAASVLNHSVAEAVRRNHGQTTPLHVAATLLASPSGFLRQACIRSHPNSSHPLQCRALELCFSVALDRLPSAQNLSPGLEPPISNALMAALKRAQAHQRRGSPEQQQPLLAVKVELEQLIISILDDPSVSRVMREASFSSPAVKATIEQAMTSSSAMNSSAIATGTGLVFRRCRRPPPSLYCNARLHPAISEPSVSQSLEEIRRVVDILLRTKKRNPILLGDSEPHSVLLELIQRIEKQEISEPVLRNVHVISLEKELDSKPFSILDEFKNLSGLIQSQVARTGGCGVMINLGDLKWLVQHSCEHGVSGSLPPRHPHMFPETAQATVMELRELISAFAENGVRVWLIGTASPETYLRCQIFHSSIEREWDLQPVPVPARVPLHGLLPRVGANGNLGSSVHSLSRVSGFQSDPLSTWRTAENSDHAGAVNFCASCAAYYKREFVKLAGSELDGSCPEADPGTRSTFPQWWPVTDVENSGTRRTDTAQSTNNDDIQKTEQLKKKWMEKCRQLHPDFHARDRQIYAAYPAKNMYGSTLLDRPPYRSKLWLTADPPTQKGVVNQDLDRSDHPSSFAQSPVRTDLVLGNSEDLERIQTAGIRAPSCRAFSEYQPLEFPNHDDEKPDAMLDSDCFHSLVKGLTEKVAWQPDAASEVATAIIKCRSGGNGRRCGAARRGATWLLFMGPDKVGKRQMALALSELICRPAPVTIPLGSRLRDVEGEDSRVQGKRVLDRISEVVGRNPLSVILLEDLDLADVCVHESMKEAIERGRILDSHGRELKLGNVIFILTAQWMPKHIKTSDAIEMKLERMAHSECQLVLSLSDRARKRRAEWPSDDVMEGSAKGRRECGRGVGLSLDLNLAAEAEVEAPETSGNSSDLTVEHGHEPAAVAMFYQDSVDSAIFFKPVDFGKVRCCVADTIRSKFSETLGAGSSVEVEDDALERIVSGMWFGRMGLEAWADEVLVPGFRRLESLLRAKIDDITRTVKLSLGRPQPGTGHWLPRRINIVDQPNM